MEPYYEDGGITIYHGDCRDILPGLNAPDVLVTDPPYGIGLGTHRDAKETRKGVGLKKQAYSIYDDTDENFQGVVVPVVTGLVGVCSRGVVFCAGTRIWDFPRASCVSAVYLPAGQGRTCWGFQNLSHVLFYGAAPDLQKGAKNTVLRSTARAEVNGHPCPKPIEWMLWAVNLASRPNETVIDPFMGSGTTLVAAKNLGRRAIGIEMDKSYCDIAVERLAQGVLFGVAR